MSTLVHLFDESRRRISAECADDEATIWLRDGQNTVSVQITPRLVAQLQTALDEARKFLAMETHA